MKAKTSLVVKRGRKEIVNLESEREAEQISVEDINKLLTVEQVLNEMLPHYRFHLSLTVKV